MKKTEHILLAKDNEDYAVLFRRALKSASIDASLNVVHDGQEAVDYLAGTDDYADRDKHPFPKLLLLDLKMPKMDGVSLADAVGELFPAIHVMLISGSPTDEWPHQPRAGCGTHLRVTGWQPMRWSPRYVMRPTATRHGRRLGRSPHG